MARANSNSFDFGYPPHGAEPRALAIRLPAKESGIKLTSALSPSEINDIHGELHVELLAAVAFWSISDDRAAMLEKTSAMHGLPLVHLQVRGPEMLRMAVAKQLLFEQLFV